MLLTLSLVFYAAFGGATFARFMQLYELLDRGRAKLLWVALSIGASLLWPLTWVGFVMLAVHAERETNKRHK